MNNNPCEKEFDSYKIANAVMQLEIMGISHNCTGLQWDDVENIILQNGILFKWSDDEKAILKDILKEMKAREEINQAIWWAALMRTEQIEHDVTIRPSPCPRLIELQDKIKRAYIEKKGRNKSDSVYWEENIFIEENYRVI